MKKPILVVMAAGMGSRYGGLKQMDPVGPNGEFIIDYSLYDAHRAGFETVVFIIKPDIEEAFRETVGRRASAAMEVRYAFQTVDLLPEGYTVPEGRVKPWGTGHAILSAGGVIDAPFAVINADDYYGAEAFRSIYRYLSQAREEKGVGDYCMVGYLLKNTVTEHGSVSRGVCQQDAAGHLTDITEHTQIEQRPEGIYSVSDSGEAVAMPEDTVVSMNLWGFTTGFLAEAQARFSGFLDDALKTNPIKGEYYLPAVVSQLLAEGRARVKILTSTEKWYGVTYQADRSAIVAALAEKTAQGIYPAPLWSGK